ncbi:MAG: RDD family protein [Burkholderiaceae bacterium]
MTETERKPNVDPWRRFMSLTYEGVILFGVVFFFGYAFSAVTQFKGAPGPLLWLFDAYLYGVLGAYFTYFWSNGRRTLPMKTMSVALLGPADAPVTPIRAWCRYTVAVAGLCVGLAATRYVSGWFFPLVILPWLTTLVDPRRRALYDIVCGTRLAYSPIARRPRAASPAAGT